MSAKSYKTLAALCAAGIALVAAPRPAMGQALPQQFVWKSLPPLEWNVTCDADGKARIEDGVLTASCAEPGVAIAEAEIDLSEYDGRRA